MKDALQAAQGLAAAGARLMPLGCASSCGSMDTSQRLYAAPLLQDPGAVSLVHADQC